MILICDREVTGRAVCIRERMLAGGIPAAVSALSSIRTFLPVRCFVTFTDVFDDLRRMPFGNVFCVAVGGGFVNSALNAVRADGEEEALSAVLQHLAGPDGTEFGFHPAPEIFRGQGFCEIRGHTVVFTPFEERLFLLLAATRGTYVTAEKIRAFCSRGIPPSDDANAIAAHVHNLNLKLAAVFGERMIRQRRLCGYVMKEI